MIVVTILSTYKAIWHYMNHNRFNNKHLSHNVIINIIIALV